MGDEFNETDLQQACHEAGFATAHRGLGTETLYQILEGRRGAPEKAPDCLLERHRRGMHKLTTRFAAHIRNQIGCNADCLNCPDAQCAECAEANQDCTQTER